MSRVLDILIVTIFHSPRFFPYWLRIIITVHWSQNFDLKFCHSKPLPRRGKKCCSQVQTYTKIIQFSIQSVKLEPSVCKTIWGGSEDLISKNYHWLNSIQSGQWGSLASWTEHGLNLWFIQSSVQGSVEEEEAKMGWFVHLPEACSVVGRNAVLMIAGVWMTAYILEHISICLFDVVLFRKLSCNGILWLDS